MVAVTSHVVFSENGAVYSPGNGHVIRYQRVNGIYYHAQTPPVVVQGLELARSLRQRIRLYYGDTVTGRDWLEEWDVEGYIGNSTGPLKVPLLIRHRRSHGGPALLDHCIVKLKWTRGGILYQHASYHTGAFTVRELRPDSSADGDLTAKGYSHAVDVDGHNQANFRTRAAAERYVRRLS